MIIRYLISDQSSYVIHLLNTKHSSNDDQNYLGW